MPTQVIQHPQGFLDGNGNYHVGACFTDMVYDKETKESLASILDEINQKIESGTGGGATVNWDDIQGKPDKFTPADGTYPNITVGNATNSKNATIAGTANVANQWSILSYSSEVQTVQPGYALLFNGMNTVTPYPVGQMTVARANNISMGYDGNLWINYS